MKRATILGLTILALASCKKDCDCGTITSKVVGSDGWSDCVLTYDNKCNQTTETIILTPEETQLYSVGSEYCY